MAGPHVDEPERQCATKGSVMSGITLDQLRERTRGMVIVPGDAAYDEARKVYNGMIEQAPRGGRPLSTARPTSGRGHRRLRRTDRPIGPRRWAQRAGLRYGRRWPGHRPVGDPGRRAGSAGPHWPGAAAGHLGRFQRRDPRVRSGDDRRHHRHDRHRGVDAGWRHRLPRTRVRARPATTYLAPRSSWPPARW